MDKRDCIQCDRDVSVVDCVQDGKQAQIIKNARSKDTAK